jgi:short-subunit dehydrogenase
MDLATDAPPMRSSPRCRGEDRHRRALVNDAGFAMFGRFAEDEPREQGEMLHVNILALTELTRRFLPRMIERGSGRIQNIASTAAFQPGPLMGVYYATNGLRSVVLARPV